MTRSTASIDNRELELGITAVASGQRHDPLPQVFVWGWTFLVVEPVEAVPFQFLSSSFPSGV